MYRSKENRNSIKLLIAESSRLSCELLENALQRHRQRLSVVAAVTDSDQIPAAYAAKKPEICAISARLRDGVSQGIHVTRELRASHEGARVIMLIDSGERDAVVEAFRSGALGVFSRDGSFDELYKSIQKVNAGQVWASNEQLQFLVESLASKTQPPITDAKGCRLLTTREQSLVDLVAQGRTNRDISRELNLSEHTVRNYLFRIFNKLGTSNRLELALYAINRRESNKEEVLAQTS
jgi:DNA-binding NarL/FixJ family response regulator